MRTLIGGLVLALLGLGLPQQAKAEPHWYAGAGIGLNKLTSLEEKNVNLAGFPGAPPFGDVEIKFDFGFNFHVRGGAYVLPRLRVEGELNYIDSDVKEVNVAGTTYKADSDLWLGVGTINVLYDILDSSSSVIPFVGAGFGMAYTDIEDITDEGIAATGIVGLSFTLRDKMRFEPSYKLLWLNGQGDDFYIHMVRIGLIIGIN